MNPTVAIIGLLFAAAGYRLLTRWPDQWGQGGSPAGGFDPYLSEIPYQIGQFGRSLLPGELFEGEGAAGGGEWDPPAGAGPYLPVIREMERRFELPHNLLARLLYQESRYRADIINGETLSPVGAVGIAQVMPATAANPGWGVQPLDNPRDPFESIRFAGEYLRALYDYLGSWRLALAAYNGGAGHVDGPAGLAGASQAAQIYVAQITADVPVA